MLHVSEELSVATADTPVNATVYSSTVSTSAIQVPVRFTLRSCTINMQRGTAEFAKVFAIVRRVPSGYSFPSITIATGNSSFIDIPDVLAYGFLDESDTVPYKLDKLRSSIVLHPGDTLAIQFVSNLNSAGLKVDAITAFTVCPV